MSMDQIRCGTLSYTRRGLVALFAWLLWGDVCFTLMEAVVPSVLPLKLRSLDSSNMVIGLIMTTLPGIFNLTVTPALSFKSDRHRSRWGRRLPFILSTMPFLAAALILIAFSDSLGAWVHGAFFAGSSVSQAKVMIILLAVFAALFDLFNMFVNTVFWYLFKDVVPETHLARFSAWFGVVGTATGAFYNFFVFKYAESHMREIFIGAALVYLFGFGLMCLMVKEGDYPPVTDVTERSSMLDKIKIFLRESFCIRYYWDIFLYLTLGAMAATIGVYQVFFSKSLGLSLDLIGKISAVGAVTGPICLLLLAGRVDRWHPVRVQAYGFAFTTFFAFSAWVWLFVMHPPPMLYFWIAVINSSVFAALLAASARAAGGPALMLLFPGGKYGQFSGAMALIRAIAMMIAGVMSGLYIDFWRYMFPDGDYCYRFTFLWHAPLTLLSFYFFYRVYRVWKRLGGVVNYVAPETNVRIKDLPARPDHTSSRHPWMIGLSAIAFAGLVLGTCVWIGYWMVYQPRPDYVRIFILALLVNIALYIAYLRFMRFMERP